MLDSDPSSSKKLRLEVVADIGLGKPSAQKRRRSSGIPMRVQSAASTHRANKQKRQRQLDVPTGRNYTDPIGMRWSQNSCAYDSIFTPIYLLWCIYRDTWTEEIQRTGSTVAMQLVEGFIRFEKGLGSLEDARDEVRRTLARTERGCVYGNYTSLDSICSVWFKTNEVVFERFYQCPNGHRVHHSNDCDAYLSIGTVVYASISQWISINSEHTSVRCQICSRSAGIRLRFCSCPPILAFQVDPTTYMDHNLSVQIGNRVQVQRYALAAVIYYAHEHFTAQIITRDGRVWFYDGMAIARQNNPALENVGSINDMSFNMQTCHGTRGGSPCMAMYARI